MASISDITVDFEEVGGSPSSEEISIGTNNVNRQFRVKWADRRLFAAQMLGITNPLLPTDPVIYQDDASGLVTASSVGIVPEGILIKNSSSANQRQSINTYEIAICTVAFKLGNFQVDNGVLYEEELNPTAEFLTIPHYQLYWDAAKTKPLAPGDAPGFLVKMAEWTVTKYNLKGLSSSVTSLMGQVNSAAVTSKTLGLTFAAETVLYHGPQPRRSVTMYPVPGASGPTNGLWTNSLKFTIRPFSWNLFFKPGNATPQAIYDSSGTQFKPYTGASFANLY